MRTSIFVVISAAVMAFAAPTVDGGMAADALEARQSGLGCVYGNNQCPAKCRARYGGACTNSYCVTPSNIPYGSCLCRC
ncbi:hypothetical protein ACHAQA_008451 [Verticillium albo-atrum]